MTYHLRRTQTADGKSRYVMKRSPGEGALEAVPDGYEVVENVNGQVSIRRFPRRFISEVEEAAVSAALRKHGREDHRFEIKGRRIVIYKPRLDAAEYASRLSQMVAPDRREAVERELREEAERRMSYSPVLRFTLVNEKKRTFHAERMCYLSSIDGWLEIAWWVPLPRALDAFVPHLGQESFFSWCYGLLGQP